MPQKKAEVPTPALIFLPCPTRFRSPPNDLLSLRRVLWWLTPALASGEGFRTNQLSRPGLTRDAAAPPRRPASSTPSG